MVAGGTRRRRLNISRNIDIENVDKACENVLQCTARLISQLPTKMIFCEASCSDHLHPRRLSLGVWLCVQIQATGTGKKLVNHCCDKAFMVGLLESLSCWLKPLNPHDGALLVRTSPISYVPSLSSDHLFQFKIYIMVHWNFGYPHDLDEHGGVYPHLWKLRIGYPSKLPKGTRIRASGTVLRGRTGCLGTVSWAIPIKSSQQHVVVS